MREIKKARFTDEEARRIFQERMDIESRRPVLTPEQEAEGKRRRDMIHQLALEGLREQGYKIVNGRPVLED